MRLIWPFHKCFNYFQDYATNRQNFKHKSSKRYKQKISSKIRQPVAIWGWAKKKDEGALARNQKLYRDQIIFFAWKLQYYMPDAADVQETKLFQHWLSGCL